VHEEATLHNRLGEATHLLWQGGCHGAVGDIAEQWWQRYQRLMARCDTCQQPLSDQQQQQQQQRRKVRRQVVFVKSCCL
jgi:hypothetical protein